ncbi:MAG: hypothetical protein JNM81_09285 [Rhodospirillaceae bacterium]|nr:hypothetical protein [Rhodospirillaceae bacterium]
MWRAVTSFSIICMLWAAPAAAQCIAPLSELQTTITASEKSLRDITRKAVKASDQTTLIARLETERKLRGARQAFNEALQAYRAQGKALVAAAERASRGQITPSVKDALACEQGECERIGAVEHAAMIAIGATAETADLNAWPAADHACDFTLLSPDTARKGLWRTLIKDQTATPGAAQDYAAYWSELGYAVITATLKLERGRVNKASELETAALLVMGANPARKAKACLLERTATRGAAAVFAPVPAPQC